MNVTNVMRYTVVAGALAIWAGAVSAVSVANAAVDFEKQIAPILKARCVECHGANKAKGKLRLDERQFVLERSADDAIIVPGNAQDSEIIYRIALPADDVDIMPPEGDTLTPDQVALFKQWINEGANWPEGIVLSEVEEKTESNLPPVPALSLAEEWAAGVAMEQIRESGALAMRIAADSPWVDVNYSLVGKDISNEHLQPLIGISSTATWVNLANTQITDAALDTIAKLGAITRLHLENTKVTDAGLAKLAGLQHLRYINLYGTGVTDEGIKHLASLPHLEQVYLWQTQVTDAGVAMLEKALPQVYINTGARLVVVEPEPEPEATVATINTKCPVSGKALAAGQTVTYKDQVIGFCCGDCKAAFEKDPAKFIAKVENFEEPKPDAPKLAAVNGKCPISGKPIAAGFTVTYQEQVIGFCCGNCKASFEKDPAKFIAKVEGFTPPKAPETADAGKPINTICPLSGKEVDPKHVSVYKGQAIGLCCPICKQVFEQDPAKHIGKVKEFKDPELLKPVNAKCPASGKDVNAEFVVVYEGLPIAFCCGNCKAGFEKKIAELKASKAAPAAEKKSEGEKDGEPVSAVPVNGKCPVSGNAVDKAFTVAHKGQTVGFCCEKCSKKFADAPAQYEGKVIKEN